MRTSKAWVLQGGFSLLWFVFSLAVRKKENAARVSAEAVSRVVRSAAKEAPITPTDQ